MYQAPEQPTTFGISMLLGILIGYAELLNDMQDDGPNDPRIRASVTAALADCTVKAMDIGAEYYTDEEHDYISQVARYLSALFAEANEPQENWEDFS